MSFDAETRDHRRIQRFHAMAACRARYGINLTHGDYALICDRVWSAIYGAGDHDVDLARQDRYRDRFYVRYKGALMLVAWSRVTMQVATFLPRWSALTERETDEGTRRWIAENSARSRPQADGQRVEE